MKITVDVNGKPVEIELTSEQVAVVKKHTEKITDRIKSFKDVLEAVTVARRKSFYKACSNLDVQGEANEQVKLIAEVLNEGWLADAFDENQYKYYPYFEAKNGRFVFGGYDYWTRAANVGSRLCFSSRELATFAGKTFIDIYSNLLK